MAQMCPAKSTIVPFKKQMYGSGSIILSYKDDKCICVSIHAPTRGATNQLRSTDTSIMFQSTHPRGGATPEAWCGLAFFCRFNPRTHEGCDDTSPNLALRPAVSIHAPTRGATEVWRVEFSIKSVSIHAPTRGAT